MMLKQKRGIILTDIKRKGHFGNNYFLQAENLIIRNWCCQIKKIYIFTKLQYLLVRPCHRVFMVYCVFYAIFVNYISLIIIIAGVLMFSIV